MAKMMSLMSPAHSESTLLHDSIPLANLYKDDNKLSKAEKKALKSLGERGQLRGKADMAAERVRIEEYCRKKKPHDKSGNESDADSQGGDVPEGYSKIKSLGKVEWRRNPLTGGRQERGFWVRWDGCTAADDTWEPESGLPADMVAEAVAMRNLVASV